MGTGVNIPQKGHKTSEGCASLWPMRPLSTSAALAAVFLAVFMATGLRLVDEDLRAATRGTSAVAKNNERAGEARRSDDAASLASQSPDRPAQVELVVRTPRQSFVLLLCIAMPAQLAAGAYAFGTSLLKCKRWSAIGGHGRHGPGGRI